MTPPYDLLASGILLGGSSVALALTALAARRIWKKARIIDFAATSAIADRKAAHASEARTAVHCETAKRHSQNAMKAANAIELSRLFDSPAVVSPSGITITAPETVDVIPIPVPAPKLYEVEGVPGAVVYGDDPGDVNVIEFPEFREYHDDKRGA